jgi:hypothetical protein
MDANVGGMIAAGGVSGGVIAIIYVVWKLFKHSRCKSACCGHEAAMSIDLEKGFETKKEEVSTPPPVVVVKDARF